VRIIVSSANDTTQICWALNDIQQTYGNYEVEAFSNDIMIVKLNVGCEYKKMKHEGKKYKVVFIYAARLFEGLFT
jgi:hypothetical protein